MSVDLDLLAQIVDGAVLPPTVKDAVDALLAATVFEVVLPPFDGTAVAPGCYALVEVRR